MTNQPDVGKAVTRLRESKGVTQKELAERLFIDRETLRLIENGVNAAPQEMLNTMLRVLEIPLADLIHHATSPEWHGIPPAVIAEARDAVKEAALQQPVSRTDGPQEPPCEWRAVLQNIALHAEEAERRLHAARELPTAIDPITVILADIRKMAVRARDDDLERRVLSQADRGRSGDPDGRSRVALGLRLICDNVQLKGGTVEENECIRHAHHWALGAIESNGWRRHVLVYPVPGPIRPPPGYGWLSQDSHACETQYGNPCIMVYWVRRGEEPKGKEP